MSRVRGLAGTAALVTMMVISGVAAVMVPGAATPLKSQNPAASAPGGDGFEWCDKGPQEAC